MMHNPFQSYQTDPTAAAYAGIGNPFSLPFTAMQTTGTNPAALNPLATALGLCQTAGVSPLGQTGYSGMPNYGNIHPQHLQLASLLTQAGIPQGFGQNPIGNWQNPYAATVQQNPWIASGQQNPILSTVLQNPLIAAGLQNPLYAGLQNPLVAAALQNPLLAVALQNPYLNPMLAQQQGISSLFGQQGSPYGQTGSPFGQQGSPFGQQGLPFGQQGSPFGQQGSPFGQQGSPFGQQGSPFGQQGSPFGQQG